MGEQIVTQGSRRPQHNANSLGQRPEAVFTHVHGFIQEHARQHGTSVAISSQDFDLTYAQLDSLSSLLACHLIHCGATYEGPIPLLFGKSAWTVVSMLSVLKAGGAFVPLDMSQPIGRIKHIVNQTDASLVLTSNHYLELGQKLAGHAIQVDKELFQRLEASQRLIQLPVIKPSHSAYIMFTSGTTGIPKGVVVEHGALSTGSRNCGQRMGFSPHSRMLQFSSYAFDACILEIFFILVFGGTVCVISEWDRQNGIAEAMERLRVTVALFTPSLLDNLTLEHLPTLTTLIVGGEIIPESLVQKWASKVRLILAYGPTECCVVCFVTDCSIGKPLPRPGELGQSCGSHAWIAKQDNCHELAADGEIGELLIEGPILARGYLKNAEKTGQAFVQNLAWMREFTFLPGCTRFYRTGDLARYESDGTFYYQGRVDNQVKIRGQRLETGEVEKQLQSVLHDVLGDLPRNLAVVEAVSLQQSLQLICFLYLPGSEEFGYLDLDIAGGQIVEPTCATQREQFCSTVISFNERLQTVLPAYAIPAAYIPLRKVPFAASGKIDRGRLRGAMAGVSMKEISSFTGYALDAGAASVEAPITVTAVTSRLLDLWADTLRLAPSALKPSDNFFLLGGNSILAMKLVAEARKHGLDLTLQTIFEHPTLASMEEATADLGNHFAATASITSSASTTEGRADMEDLRRGASQQCSIETNNIKDIYPCSPVQVGLLALSGKVTGAYIMQLTYRLPASTDINKLERAWQQVIAQTDILKTRFFEHDDEFYQVVCADIHTPWSVSYHELPDFLQIEKGRAMPIGSVMSNFTVLRQENNKESFLVWSVHHALLDGWTASLIAPAVEEEYFGYPWAKTCPGSPYKIFVDYVNRQNKSAAKKFWQIELQEAPPPSFPALPHPSYIPRATSVSEFEISSFRRDSFTAGTIMQAAWALLLGTYSNCSDVVTGITLNGRGALLPNVDSICGPTITTVPFRTKFRSDQTVSNFLHSVQRHYLDILPFEQYGMSNIKRISHEASTACQFRSLLLVQAFPEMDDQPKLLRDQTHSFTALDCGLLMECLIGGSSTILRATFDKNLLNSTQVDRMYLQLEVLLQRLSYESLSSSIADTQRISDADQLQIMKWNAGRPLSVKSCIHTLVEQRAKEVPIHPAICAWNGDLSYRELDIYSSRLATYLRLNCGIGLENMIMICFEKSKWTVVAMLAVLKTGATCIPLDPKTPKKRLSSILAGLGSSSANLILVSPGLEKLSESGSTILTVDQHLFDSIQGEVVSIVSNVGPSHAAFILFTSGSTGVPKGVVLEHGSLVSSVLAHGSFTGLGRQSRVFQFAAHTFDISISDMFATLIHGGCVCIPSEHDRLSNLAGSINSLKANHVSLTSSVIRQLTPKQVPRLKVLVQAGEAMHQSVLETWAEEVNLINLYGPTECSVYSTGKANISKQGLHCDIGQGVGTITWVVDPQDSQALTPIGGIGELLLEGPNLARGYLHDTAKTESAFVENLIWATSASSLFGQRFYKTGDLVSYLPDGSLAFHGRKDNQIKIRGQRLEIAEVEHHLSMTLPSNVRAAVVAAAPRDGEKILVAFLETGSSSSNGDDKTTCDTEITDSGQNLERFQELVQELESELPNTLPTYMIPTSYLPLKKMPLSSAAKIDRRKLQSIVSSKSKAEVSEMMLRTIDKTTNCTGPETEMEQRMSQLWKKTLQVEKTRMNDNFLRLGGDSIMAMQMVSLARREGISLTVAQVFQHPTLREIATIASYIDRKHNTVSDILPFSFIRDLDVNYMRTETARQCGVCEDQIEDILPSTLSQAWWLEGAKRAPDQPRDNQSQAVFSIPSSFDINRFKKAWDSIFRRHSIFRTRLVDLPTGIFQVVTDDTAEWSTSSSLCDYLRQDELQCVGYGDRQIRLCLVHDSETDRASFVLTVFHGIHDDTSIAKLFQELEAGYSCTPLSNTSQMSQLVHFHQKADKQAAVNFWMQYLDGASPKPFLSHYPAERRLRPQTASKVTFQLPSRSQNTLEITWSNILKVATGLAIAHDSGSADILFRDVNIGRHLPVPGIENLMGPTITHNVTRVRRSLEQNANNLLHSFQAGQIASLAFSYFEIEQLQQTEQFDQFFELKPEPYINVSTGAAIVPGEEMGLKLTDWIGRHELVWGLFAHIGPEEIELNLITVEEFCTVQRREMQLQKIERVFLSLFQAATSNTDMTVDEVLGC